MLGFLFSGLKMRAIACKYLLRSTLVGASKGAGIIFGSITSSVSCWGQHVFLNLWAIFFQLNLVLAHFSFVGSAFISFFLTLLMVAGATIHAVLYTLPSATLSYVYNWLFSRAKFLAGYLVVLAFLSYYFGSPFLNSLVQLRTFCAEAVKNLVETGGVHGVFPYGDLELGFIDVAGVYTLFQGFFISSSGLAFLLQNSMFISLAFVIVFPFCLGTGVFMEGIWLSVGFPLFHVSSSPLPKDLPSIVKDLDKKLVVKHPNLEKLFVKQPKSFFHYFFKGPDSTKFIITPPHGDFVAAHEEAARKVRGYLLNEGVVNVAEFIGSAEQFIKQMELSGHKPTPTETALYYELVTQVSIYGIFVDPKTCYPCYDLSPEYRATIFLGDTQFRNDSLKALGSTRVLFNLGNEVFAVSGHYIKTGEFLIRPEFSGSGKHLDVLKPTGDSLEIKTFFSGLTTAAKVENIVGNPRSNTFGTPPLVLSARNFGYTGPHVDSTALNGLFTEKTLPKSNIITDALNESRQLNNPRGDLYTPAIGINE